MRYELSFTVAAHAGHAYSRPAYVPLELGDREAGPQPWCPDYADVTQYEADWYLWRAIRRDAQLTEAEGDAKMRVLEDVLTRRYATRAQGL